MKENAIEWITGQQTVTVTFSQGRFINKLKQLADRDERVQIIAENADGSVCAHVPLSFVKISIPRQLTDEQKDRARERLAKYRNGVDADDSDEEEEEEAVLPTR